jgi:hypothetical protein
MSKPLRGDRVVTEQQRRSGIGQDEIALAILRLKSATEPGGVPNPSVEGNRSSTSTILRFCAIFGAVALASAVIAGLMLRPSTRQAADKAGPVPVAAPSISVAGNEGLPQAEAAAPPLVPNRDGKTEEPRSQPEPMPAAAVPPLLPPQPLQAASAPTEQAATAPTEHVATAPTEHVATAPTEHVATAPTEHVASAPTEQAATAPTEHVATAPTEHVASAPTEQAASAPTEHVATAPTEVAPVEPQSPPMQGDSAARHLLDAEEIASLVARGTAYLKAGDIASARLLLRRAAEAGSASAALTLGTTFDPLVIQQLGAFGVVPDVAQARQWYEKAEQLGSEAASQRLAKLAHPGQ